MEVYDRAVRTVPQEERLSIYDQYLARASTFFGIAKVCAQTLRPSNPVIPEPESFTSRYLEDSNF